MRLMARSLEGLSGAIGIGGREGVKGARGPRGQPVNRFSFCFFASSVFFLCVPSFTSQIFFSSSFVVFASARLSIQLLLTAVARGRHRTQGRGAAVGGASKVAKQRAVFWCRCHQNSTAAASFDDDSLFSLSLFFSFSRSDDNLL